MAHVSSITKYTIALLSCAIGSLASAQTLQAQDIDADNNVAAPTELSDSAQEGLNVKPKVQGQPLSALGQLYEQRLILKAQAELMDAQAKVKTTGVQSSNINESYAPAVKMVQGVGNNLYATFLYPGNMTVDAKVGDTISGGYTVKSINVNQVTLEKDGETMNLRFSASPPTPLPQSFSGGGQSFGSGGLQGFN